jgi:ribosomal protein S12 methylthiotransferase
MEKHKNNRRPAEFNRKVRKVSIENLGCAKNQVDAEVMLDAMLETGSWEYSDLADTADLIIINTCGFIEPAREESLATLFEMRAEYPDKKIIMAGCLAERYGRQISGELGEADGFFGNLNLPEITVLAEQVMQGDRAELYPDLPEREYFMRRKLFSFPGSAYLKISEGCSHHCRYCAIPLIRGELRSRPFDETIRDAEQLIASGVREINLIAQDLAAYGTEPGRLGGAGHVGEAGHVGKAVNLGKAGRLGKDRLPFLELLDALSTLPGEHVLRMLYIHPDDFPADLPRLVKERENILPYFDIPFQHAAAPVLRGMGRKGSAESYLELLQNIRGTLPDAVIRSTFMLGFPGERKQHVDELMRFVEAARLDWAGLFIYSPEEGTPAYRLRTPDSHKRAARSAEPRKKELEALQTAITEQQLERWVGREFDVLIEEKIEGEDLLIGRMSAQAPEVDGSTVVLSDEGAPGDVIRCGIRRRVGIDLEAVPVSR